MKLRLRGTFLDCIPSSDGSNSPRAHSEPDLHRNSGDESFNHHYTENLSDKISSLWSTYAASSKDGSESVASDPPLEKRMSGDASSNCSGGVSHAQASNQAAPSPRLTLTEPSYLWKRHSQHGVTRKELRYRICADTKRLSDSLKLQRAHEALTAIDELPEHIEEVLQQSAAAIFEDVQSKVAAMREWIQSRPTYAKQERLQEAVASLDIIPEIMWDSFSLQAAEAREILRRRIDEVTQGLGKGGCTMDEELLSQMNGLPSRVQIIAEEAVQAAVMESQAQAQKQFEQAMQKLPEESQALRIGNWQVVAGLPQASAGAQQSVCEAATDPIQQKIDAVPGNDDEIEGGFANQVVAEVLLRAKADGPGNDNRRLDLQSFATVVANREPGFSSHLGLHRLDDGSIGEEESVNNPGSIGHPELCPRPCLYFTNNLCQSGSSCDFCHLPHPKRAAHLDKRHRDLLKSLPYDQRVRIVLPILRQKALQVDSSNETLHLLDDIGSMSFVEPDAMQCDRQEMSFMAPIAAAEPLTRKSEQTLASALRCLSLRSLIVSLNRAPVARQQMAIEDLLHRLRVQCQLKLDAGLDQAEDGNRRFAPSPPHALAAESRCWA